MKRTLMVFMIIIRTKILVIDAMVELSKPHNYLKKIIKKISQFQYM